MNLFMYWTYDKNSLPDIIPLSNILSGCNAPDAISNFVFSAFRQAVLSPLGTNLIHDVEQVGCHISIVHDLPYYGLVIPAGQGPENLSAPLILMSGDVTTWRNNEHLATFVSVHETFHVLQGKAGLLNIPNVGGVQHGFSNDVLHMQAESTLITERAADLAAVMCCLTSPGKEDYKLTLAHEVSLKTLIVDCYEALSSWDFHGNFVERSLQIDSFDVEALRYYSRYTQNFSLKDAFARAAPPHSTDKPSALDRLIAGNAQLITSSLTPVCS